MLPRSWERTLHGRGPLGVLGWRQDLVLQHPRDEQHEDEEGDALDPSGALGTRFSSEADRGEMILAHVGVRTVRGARRRRADARLDGPRAALPRSLRPRCPRPGRSPMPSRDNHAGPCTTRRCSELPRSARVLVRWCRWGRRSRGRRHGKLSCVSNPCPVLSPSLGDRWSFPASDSNYRGALPHMSRVSQRKMEDHTDVIS